MGGRGRGRGLSEAQPDAPGGRDLERGAGQPDRRPGARARGWCPREREHVLDAGRGAARRPHVHGAGRSAQWSEARRSRSRAVEAALLVRHLAHRAIGPHQRQRLRGRGRDAPGLRSPDRLSQSRTHAALDTAADESGRYQSWKPRFVRGRPPEARRDGATGRRRAARHRARDDERRPLPGPDAVRHGRALARGRGRRVGAPVDLAALWRRRIPAAHRLRKCRQSAARARGGAPARDGRARGPWRQRPESPAPTAHREPGADRGQRHRWPEPGVRRRTVRRLVEPGRHPTARRRRARHAPS